MRGIDRAAGCIVVVRPDQYVAQVLPLDGYGELAAYFDGFMLPQEGSNPCRDSDFRQQTTARAEDRRKAPRAVT
jgi:hypothetical protein